MKAYKIFKKTILEGRKDKEPIIIEAFKVCNDEGETRYEVFAGDIKWRWFHPSSDEEAIRNANDLAEAIETLA